MGDVRLEIHFVRHAQSLGNIGLAYPRFHPDDPPLTELGLRQAGALALRYAPGELDGICASTLVRACQTAEPLAERFGMPVTVLHQLREVNTAIAGTPLEDLKALAPAAYESARGVLPLTAPVSLLGETPEALRERAKAAIGELLRLYPPGARILVATHASYFGYLLRACLGLTLPEPFGWKVDNCAVTAVALREGATPLLLCANEKSHMYHLLKEAY